MIRTTLRMTALGAGTLLALATLASPPSQAQTPATGAAVAFTNVRIIDGTGRAPIERGTLVISNGRVTAVGPTSTAIPAGAATAPGAAGAAPDERCCPNQKPAPAASAIRSAATTPKTALFIIR